MLLGLGVEVSEAQARFRGSVSLPVACQSGCRTLSWKTHVSDLDHGMGILKSLGPSKVVHSFSPKRLRRGDL